MYYGYNHMNYANEPMYRPSLKLAEAYVPYQLYRCIYPLPLGFERGTIFQELYRPYHRSRY